MKKVLLAVAVTSTLVMSAQTEEKVYRTTEFVMSPTGVSNDGKVVGGSGQDTPFILWDPRGDGTARVIGGMSSGQDGAAGPARITADGMTVIGSMWDNDIDVPITWSKSTYEKYPYAFTYWAKQSDFNIFIGASIPDSEYCYFYKTTNNGVNWRETTPGTENLVVGKLTGMMAMNNMTTFCCTDKGNLYSQSGNMSWKKVNVNITGDDVPVKGYLSLGIVAKNWAQGAFGAIGVEHEDGSYAVWYSTDNFQSFNVAEGVSGKPVYMTSTEEVLYMTTENGHVQKSVDKGQTWTDIYVDENKQFTRVSFNDDEYGIIISDRDVYITKDAGKNWSVKLPEGALEEEQEKIWNDVIWRDGYVILVGAKGRVYISENDALSFTKQNIEGIGEDNITLCMFDRNVVNVLADNGNFYRLSITPSAEGYVPGVYDVLYNAWMPMKTFGEVTDKNAGSSWGISENAAYVCGIANKLNPVTKNYNGGAAVWTPETVIKLENMFNDDPLAQSRANAVSDDGNVVVGFQDKMGPWMACIWKRNAEGTYEQRLLFKDLDTKPENVDFTNFDDILANCLGNALAVSPSGYWVGGTGGSWYCTPNAWIWNEDEGMKELPVTGATVAVTDDGKMAVGRGDGGFGAWLWTEEDGCRDLSEVVTALGGSFEDALFPTGFYCMSPNKRFLVGHAIDGENHPHAYLLDLLANEVNVEKINANQVKASVYPNPVVSELHVDLPYDAETVKTTITLVNMQGAVCRRVDNASHTNVINVEGLGEGIYILDVQAGNTHKTFKVVVK